MARTKPNMTQVWASSVDAQIEDPNSQYGNPDKIIDGWVEEIPFHESENFMRNRADQMLAHINDYGIVNWDSETDYPVGAWIRSSVDGNVYVSKQTPNINQEPSATASYWDTIEGFLGIGTGAFDFSTSGYWTSDNGLLIQWGAVSNTSGQTISFPITFPNQVFVITVSDESQTPVNVGYSDLVESSFVIRSSTGPGTFSYIAIGH